MTEVNYWQRGTRRVSRRAALRGFGLGVVGLAGAALLGCSDDSDDGGSGTVAPGNGTGIATATQSASEATWGGHLRVGSTLEPSTLDPVRAVSGGDDVFARPMYDYLLARDENDEIELDRSLAESFEVEDDTHLIFKLRQGVKFHDGSDFDAESVVWNFDYLTDPDVGSVSRQSYLVINDIETVDEYTVRYTLNQPNADLLVNLGGRGGQMLSRAEKELLGDEFGARPSGTGPFIFNELASGAFLNVRRNEDYWRKDASGQAVPYLDEVTIRVIADGTTRAAALTTGDIELAGVDPKDVAMMQQSNTIDLLTNEGVGFADVIISNPDIAPVDNPDLRRAINWAVNPEAVNQAVFFGLNTVARGGYGPPKTWFYMDMPDRPAYDPERARQYLLNAGYPDGLEIDALTYSAPNIVQKTEVYQAQLAEVGIDLRVKTGDVGSATQEFFEGRQMPVYSTSWSSGSAPDGLIRGFSGNQAYYNPSKEDWPEMQDLLDRAVGTYDQEERLEYYRQINVLGLEDARWIPHLYTNSFNAVSKKIQNQQKLTFGLGAWRFEDIWLA